MMRVLVSYISTILIWSTTPLAIKLSNDSLSPHFSVLLRMLLAFAVVAALVVLWKPKSVLKCQNWKIYLAAALGVFPSMPLAYVAANHISSGMIAVIFALNPLFAGIFASWALNESFFNTKRLTVITLALFGLAMVFHEQISLNQSSWFGICLVLLSTFCFAASQVAVKYLQRVQTVDAIEQVLGSLCVALPGLFFIWLWFDDASMPQQLSLTSLYATLYLAIIGTVLGFYTYFHALNNLKVSLIAVIPLVPPVLALWIGAYFANEKIGLNTVLGTLCMIFSLLLYNDFFMAAHERCKRLIRVLHAK